MRAFVCSYRCMRVMHAQVCDEWTGNGDKIMAVSFKELQKFPFTFIKPVALVRNKFVTLKRYIAIE